VFNYVNLQPYHYGANNPLKYVDPDGRHNRWWEMSAAETDYQVDQRQARDQYFDLKGKGQEGDINAQLQAGSLMNNIANRSLHYEAEIRELSGGITFLVGLGGQAGAASGGDYTRGFVLTLNYSDMSVITGKYDSGSLGSSIGAGTGFKVELLAANTTDPVNTLRGRSFTSGGSVSPFLLLSAGLEYAAPLDSGGVPLFGFTGSLGPSGPVELHFQYTETRIRMRQ
jgi:hypothetical protein